MTSVRRCLVFGASGMIGSQIANAFVRDGLDVVGLGKRSVADIKEKPAFQYVRHDQSAGSLEHAIAARAPYDRVVWAHGVNVNDSIYAFEPETLLTTFDANVVHVAATMNMLLKHDFVVPASRFCVVSSIWQTIARQNKLSYGISKAALQGLILSAAVDLAKDGHLINAILPGVLDTEMTRSMLTPTQLGLVQDSTLFGRLPSMGDVVAAALFFCSEQNQSVTGQFLAVDLGFRNARLL